MNLNAYLEKLDWKAETSICRRVFTTSRGHVTAAAILPATKPAEKFTPRTLHAPPASPTEASNFLLIWKGQEKRALS